MIACIRTVLLIVTLVSIISGDTLRVGADIWSPFFMNGPDGHSGIAYDILREISRRTGDSLEFISLPNLRARSMFEEKRIDIIALDSPLWNPVEHHPNMIFTNEVMAVEEFVYQLRGEERAIAAPEDLTGLKVGCMRGYYYPEFDSLFKAGAISRMDYDNEEQLLRLLINKRIDLLFMDENAFSYTMQNAGYEQEYFHKGYRLSSTAVAVKLQVGLEAVRDRFNRALYQMNVEGEIKTIKEKYTQ